MTTSAIYRWRKATDINREHALFELLDGDVPLLDVGFTDEGVFELAFNQAITEKIFEWEQFHKLLREGRTLADRDR